MQSPHAKVRCRTFLFHLLWPWCAWSACYFLSLISASFQGLDGGKQKLPHHPLLQCWTAGGFCSVVGFHHESRRPVLSGVLPMLLQEPASRQLEWMRLWCSCSGGRRVADASGSHSWGCPLYCHSASCSPAEVAPGRLCSPGRPRCPPPPPEPQQAALCAVGGIWCLPACGLAYFLLS